MLGSGVRRVTGDNMRVALNWHCAQRAVSCRITHCAV